MKKYSMDWPDPDKKEVRPIVLFVRKIVCRMKELRAKEVKADDPLFTHIDPAEIPILIQEIMEAKDVSPEVYNAASGFDQNKIDGTTTVAEFACWLAGAEEVLRTSFPTEAFSSDSESTTQDAP
ncbi:MAG: hypothetical protein A2663_02140 [Candidatus Buchananbacteria bacterium RIFCSPHIGHO2_01_FULL_46_12]|nr:MAG: hypothetical protein A2663_02140 [Candidatus Buchananbacteria bacterium RIFCSPHIGHO2_01_FULL_46_12]